MGAKILRTAVVAFMIAETVAVSQAQGDTPAITIDHAAAYYHFTLARMYATKATKSHNPEDANKAIENYKAAIKADPEAAMISDELARFERAGRNPIRISPLRVPPTAPK